MSTREKLLHRLRSLPADFQFSELQIILSQFGFVSVKTNAGSHFKWRHAEKGVVYAAPRKNPMKRIYLKQLLELLEIHFSL